MMSESEVPGRQPFPVPPSTFPERAADEEPNEVTDFEQSSAVGSGNLKQQLSDVSHASRNEQSGSREVEPSGQDALPAEHTLPPVRTNEDTGDENTRLLPESNPKDPEVTPANNPQFPSPLGSNESYLMVELKKQNPASHQPQSTAECSVSASNHPSHYCPGGVESGAQCDIIPTVLTANTENGGRQPNDNQTASKLLPCGIDFQKHWRAVSLIALILTVLALGVVFGVGFSVGFGVGFVIGRHSVPMPMNSSNGNSNGSQCAALEVCNLMHSMIKHLL